MARLKITNERTLDIKLGDGVQQYLVPTTFTLNVAGVVMTPAQLQATLTSRVAAIDAVATAKAAYQKAVADAAATQKSTQPVTNALKQTVGVMYANRPDVLATFGLAPRKVPAPLTIEQKAARSAKAKATRAARHTTGPKAKAAIKGVVATPAAQPATTMTHP